MIAKELLKRANFLQKIYSSTITLQRTVVSGKTIQNNTENISNVSNFACLSELKRQHSISKINEFRLSPLLNNAKIDLPTILITPMTLPTHFVDKDLVYIAPFDYVEKIDPNFHLNKEIIDPLASDQSLRVPKEAAKMIRTRAKKMKKHRLKKLRKKMHFEWAKIRFKREKLKEQKFQAELLGQIREAENFDAEKYVHDVLRTIRERQKPETLEENRERIMDLRRKHRSHVYVIRPKFED